MANIIQVINNVYGIAVVCLTGISHGLEAILHLVCAPLKFISKDLHNISRIYLLRLGWSPVLLAMRLANIKVEVTKDDNCKRMDILNLVVNAQGGLIENPAKPHPFLSVTNGSDRFVLMANHQAYADTFIVAFFLCALNCADGTMMWFIWKTFLFIPVGWASYMAGHVFLGGGKQDLQSLTNYLQHFKNDNFRSLCLYPEGAIYTKALYDKAAAYAKKMGYPHYKHVMCPRVVAFSACVKAMKEAGGKKIIDVTIGYPKETPWSNQLYNLIDLARFHPVPVRVCTHFREFNIEDIGETDEEIRDWLFKRYKEKDEFLEYFQKHQKFPGVVTNGTATLKKTVGDVLLWSPFMVMFMYMIGLAGIEFSYIAMTLYYIFWSLGLQLYVSLGGMWAMWISGMTLSALLVMCLPVTLIPVGIQYYFRRGNTGTSTHH